MICSLALSFALSAARRFISVYVSCTSTELGASRMLPFTSERTIPERPDFEERLGRWRRIAAAAAAQCGRAVCPEVRGVTSLGDVLSGGAEHDRRIFFWEDGGLPVAVAPNAEVRSALVVTGPEGGFTSEEAASAEAAGFTLAALGPRILRAETAAVAAVTLAQYLWGDLARAPGGA